MKAFLLLRERWKGNFINEEKKQICIRKGRLFERSFLISAGTVIQIVLQFKKYGYDYVQNNRLYFENISKKFEEMWYNAVKGEMIE